MTKITWENKQMRLGDLIEWEKNPKQISSENARRLRQSLKKFGQVAPLAVGPGGELYDGHQRKRVWSLADEYGPELMVDVRVSSRALTDDEQKELTVLLYKGATGETDFDRLSSFFEVDDLLEWGFEERELGLEDPPEEWKEYDESIADDVEMIICPNCDHSFPK